MSNGLVHKSFSRYVAVQAIYNLSLQCDKKEIEKYFLDDNDFKLQLDFDFHLDKKKFDKKFFSKIFNLLYEKNEFIDKLIKDNLGKDWSISRIPNVLLAILKAAISEMIVFPKTSIGIIISEYVILTESFFSKNEIIFVQSYFSFTALARLSIKLRQMPRANYDLFIDNIVDAEPQRSFGENELPFHINNEFESYVSKNIVKHLPRSYLELFPLIKKMVENKEANTKLIFTANSHFSSDIFKIWCGLKVEYEKAKLLVSGHGGAFPSLHSAFLEHEDEIAFFPPVTGG